MWGLAGSNLQDRGGPSEYWKVAALICYNAQSSLSNGNMMCETNKLKILTEKWVNIKKK